MSRSPISSLVSVLILVAASTLSRANDALKIGERPPLLIASECLSEPGRKMPSWEQLQGKTVVLEFWATWCGPCVGSLRKMESLCKGREDTVVIALNEESANKQEKVMKSCPSISFFRVDGQSMFDLFDAVTIPHCVVVSPTGKIVAVTLPENLTATVLDSVQRGESIDLPSKSGPGADIQWDMAKSMKNGDPEPDYQVIVKSADCQGGGQFRPRGGRRFTADGIFIVGLVQSAFDVTHARVEFALPDRWLKQRYRVSIWVPPGRESELGATILQSAIMVAPIEVELVPTEKEVWVLTHDPAIGLPASEVIGGMSLGRGNINAIGIEMTQLVATIENFEAKPVVDETGIGHRFDVRLTYDVNDRKVLREDLHKKMGLKLSLENRIVPIVKIREKKTATPANLIASDVAESIKSGDPESDYLKAIDAIQEKPMDANTDVQKWVEDCYELANKRGKLILEFYDRYPTHERTTKLLRSRWEDFFGHRRVPSMAQLDVIRDDIEAFLRGKPLAEHRVLAREFESKESLLRPFRLMMTSKISAADPKALPFLTRAKSACTNFQREYPKTETGVYLFYQYSQLVTDSEHEREAISLLAEYYPEHNLGKGAKGRQRQLDSIGKPFELEFNDFATGQKVNMGDLRGRVVLVDFWAAWCGPCRIDIETEMLKLYEELKPRGFEIVGISGDVPGDQGKKLLADYVSDKKIPWPNFYDGQGQNAGYAQSWGISSWPTQFLVDKKGILRTVKADKGDRRERIEQLLAE